MRIHALFPLVLLTALPCVLAQPAPPAPEGPSVTIYSTADPRGFDPQQFIQQQRQGFNPGAVPGFGVVKEVRLLELKEGRQTVGFTDVPQFIDPTTVSFTDLTAPQGTTVLEQQFQFDLVSPEKLLEKFIDRPITARVAIGEDKIQNITGTLLSINQGQLVIRTEQGLQLVERDKAQVELAQLPEGLITRPTLQWLLDARAGGAHQIRTTYQTDGLTWRADYNLVLANDEKTADMAAWVTLLNLSGASYANARLKLIAGDVQRVGPQRMPRDVMARAGVLAAEAPGFEEKAFFEYHLYTLPRRTTIRQNATQQLTLFPTARGVGIEKVLVYYGLPEAQAWVFPNPMLDRNLGNQSNKKVDVYLRLANTEKNNLGLPLPRGRVRVYKEDPASTGGDNTLEFIGEDLIDHTPRNEKVLIKLGQAFDVVGERTQVDFNVDQRAHMVSETIKVELRNAKKEPVKVIVKENLYRWVNWEIVKTSDDFKKIDARTVHFEVEVPAEGARTVQYTVKYTW